MGTALQVVLGIVGVLVAAIVTDVLLGWAGKRASDTEITLFVLPAQPTARQDRMIVFIPGFTGWGEGLARTFQSLNDLGHIAGVNLPLWGYDLSAIYPKLLAEATKRDVRTLVLYGPSQGGMASYHVARQLRDAGWPLRLELLVMDTTPSRVQNVKRPQWLMRLCCWYRGGPLVSLIYRTLAPFLPWPDQADTGTDPQVIAGFRRHVQTSQAPAFTGQVGAICTFQPPRMNEFCNSNFTTVYVRGSHADPIIDTDESVIEFSQVGFATFFIEYDEARGPTEHTPLVERPKFVMNLIRRLLV